MKCISTNCLEDILSHISLHVNVLNAFNFLMYSLLIKLARGCMHLSHTICWTEGIV